MIITVPFIKAQQIKFVKTNSGLRYYMPDANGKILYLDPVNGNKNVIPDNIDPQKFFKYNDGINSKNNLSFPLFPGFPDSIAGIGYNTAREGGIFCHL